MRIISGIFKGKKLIPPQNKLTRPLKDLTKESIFNILDHSHNLNFKIENSKVLDIFSGTGSFGLECISRGAKETYFVENYKPALDVLNKNITSLNLENKTNIISKSFFEISPENLKLNVFDLIFLDPPYKLQSLTDIFKNIIKMGIINDKSLIILHRHKKSDDQFLRNISVIYKKIYGSSKILFLRLR